MSLLYTVTQSKRKKAFIHAIKVIYYEQQAALCVNNDLTENFKVEKCTRQRCPLSPLPFVLVTETDYLLMRQIKEDKEIQGLKIKGFTYRAFANDVMFIIEIPLQILPILLEKIKEFRDLPGFYLIKPNLK